MSNSVIEKEEEKIRQTLQKDIDKYSPGGKGKLFLISNALSKVKKYDFQKLIEHMNSNKVTKLNFKEVIKK